MGVEGGSTFFSSIYLSICDTVPGIMAKQMLSNFVLFNININKI